MIRSSVQVRLSALLIILASLVSAFCTQAAYAKDSWYVALDPGHGGKNYGAIDPRVEGRYEKHYTLQIANQVSAHLKKAKIKVWLSRQKDEPHSLKSRISRASAAGVDLFVSIHINDAYVVGPRGHGTFFSLVTP